MENNSLAVSMEETLQIENFSFIGDIGEVVLDSVFHDGILKEVPIISTIVGTAKCIQNVSDVLFTKKLITFFEGLSKTTQRSRKEAIIKWDNDDDYKYRVGETLVYMINRCDDTQKAKWLSQLFRTLILEQANIIMFMRAEKILSSLSVLDVNIFLGLDEQQVKALSYENGELFINSGLYSPFVIGPNISGDTLIIDTITELRITECGKIIYDILKHNIQDANM